MSYDTVVKQWVLDVAMVAMNDGADRETVTDAIREMADDLDDLDDDDLEEIRELEPEDVVSPIHLLAETGGK